MNFNEQEQGCTLQQHLNGIDPDAEEKAWQIKTEDGYRFVPLGNGKWGDSDIEWESFDSMVEDLDRNGILYTVFYVESYNG